MIVSIAAVQPKTFRADREEENVSEALIAIERAADQGAQLVTFPEGYPGPYFGPLTYSPLDTLCQKARVCNVHVVASWMEPATDVGDNVFRLALKLIGPNGELIGTYHRSQPNTDDVAKGLFPGKFVVPGQELPVFETSIGTIGMLICSEIWWPELSRVLALKGADLIVAPIGGMLYEIRQTWRNIVWARASENMCYVAVSQNIFGKEDGLAMIAAPEEILAESKKSDIIYANIDLDRIKWLRQSEETLELPKAYRSIPGLFKDRRPELYGKLIEPNSDARDYYYFQVDNKKTVRRRNL